VSAFLEQAGLRVIRHPRIVAAAAIAIAAVCGVFLFRLRIDPNVEHLLPTDDPTLQLTRRLQGDAPPTKVLFVILRGEDGDLLEDAVPLAAAALKASPLIRDVAARRDEFAGARVEWVRSSLLHFVPPETLSALEKRLTEPGLRDELEALQKRLAEDPLAGKATALADPLGLRWVLEEASERLSERFPARLRAGSPYMIIRQPPLAFLRATGKDESANNPFAHALVADVRSRLEQATAGKKVRVELAGSYVSAVAQSTALRRDMIVEITVSTIAVLLFVWWFTRNLLASHLVFVPVMAAIAASLAAGSAVFGPLTPIVVSAAAILIAQGVDFPVHFFCRYRAERQTRDREGALHGAQVAMARPFVGIAATTLAAFLALLVSRFPGIRQLGFVLSVGIVFCLLAALVLFPILLLPVDRLIKPASERLPWVVRGAAAILRTRWRGALAWLLVLAGVGSWALVAHRGVRMDLDLRNAMAPEDSGRAALERLEQDIGAAMIPVYARIDGATTLEDLRQRSEALRASGTVATVDGPQALFPSPDDINRVRNFRERTKGWVPKTLGLLQGLGFRPEPFRKGLGEWEALLSAPPPMPADLEQPQFDSLRRSVRVDGDHVLALFPKRSLWRPEDRSEFDRLVRWKLGESVRLYSPFHIPDHYSQVLNTDLARVVMITAGAIVVLTLLSVGGLKDGLVALVPVVLATGMTLAVVVLTGGQINVINMAAIPIILAVGVDGGIHFMVRFRESRERDPATTIREVGPGIWGSAATTLLGFGSIASSATPGMASMGYLVVVGTVSSLLASLFLLPGLLKARYTGNPT
jgi:uncharacterized protein